ncbi:Membrane carboxypeptidase (penicillin-binding protein) [Nitrosovibrio sp. Nv17]|nr:Membrane carboxypeptidase (penicillin-binding protein) [Nitrosovibrio sp. Nv17]
MLILFVAALMGAAWFLVREAETSEYQARYLAGLSGELGWEMKGGAAGDFHFPQSGPYDLRLGYATLPGLLRNLAAQGFHVHAQARPSARMRALVERGLYVPYHEKSQAGLEIVSDDGQPLYRAAYPSRVYGEFRAIPPLVTESLLFIENRELLDARHPKRNPAIEWDRLGRAVLDKGIQFFDSGHNVVGGSTLATQIEKYRHSRNGLTVTPEDKLRQVASASVRAYLDGEETLAARRRIVAAYLDTVPLAGAATFGEANGLGDGLWIWYGLDFEETNRILHSYRAGDDVPAEVAHRYKHVLSLIVAQRRPSYYLLAGRSVLEMLTNSHLRLLARADVISPALRDAALEVPLGFRATVQRGKEEDFPARKAVNAVRTHLASLLGLKRMYDLDRLDLSVRSTLDANLQRKTTEILRRLREPEYARAAGLQGHRMLGTSDPGKVIYSFTLSELTPEGAKFRIQADNFEQPLDINRGTKLDLGSTAKLRTLVTYLEIVEALHQRYGAMAQRELQAQAVDPDDALSRWAIGYLARASDRTLAAMLEAALERRYSASARERFLTGGGVHAFRNFKREDDGRTPSVREATLDSINLVYIRLMRDIVRHHMFQVSGSSARLLRDAGNPDRQVYLRRFADREGKVFVNRFYFKYRGEAAAPDRLEQKFLSSFRHTPRRLAAAYRYLHPESALAEFEAFMRPHLPPSRRPAPTLLPDLYEHYAPGKYSLADLGYIVTVHPLELWLVRHLLAHPQAHQADVIEASAEERVAVYHWLFRTKRKNAQDIRIRGLLELEAFLEIHRSWKRLGYPFDSLVPSLATAIGSSADHPAALAELMGIILNDGVRVPAVLVERLHFGAGTPYETLVGRMPARGERMFSPELAAAVRGVLTDVVAAGTASRLARAMVEEDGGEILIGGKTGTGDHRHTTFSAPGVIRESRAVNRSATFVFFIGDRFFGTMTAFVPGTDAEHYTFTSALSTQVVKHLLPALRPLTDRGEFLSGGSGKGEQMPGTVPAGRVAGTGRTDPGKRQRISHRR